MRSSVRTIAWVYGAVVFLAALWAWYTEIDLRNSATEHLLPGILLALVTLPSSQSLGLIYGRWPAFFDAPFTQLAWLTACGAFQAAALYLLPFLAHKGRDRKQA